MASPLPSGWVDTGVQFYLSASCSVSILMVRNTRVHLQLGTGMAPWTIYGEDFPFPGNCPDDRKTVAPQYCRLQIPHGELVDLETLTETCVAHWGQLSASYEYSGTFGPFRLGVSLAPLFPETPKFPRFAGDYVLQYSWFADADTKKEDTFAGHMAPTRYWVTGTTLPPDSNAVLQVGSLLTGLMFDIAFQDSGAGVEDEAKPKVKIENISVTGVGIDNSDLNENGLVGLGSGIYGYGNSGGGIVSISPSYVFTETVDVTQFGNGSVGAVVVDVDANERATPYSVHRVHQNVSWPTSQPAFNPVRWYSIQSAWATAQDPPMPTDDLSLPIQMPPPCGGSNTYSPVSVTLAPELSILRPDGTYDPDTQSWVSSDTDKLTVEEQSDRSIFHVTASGGQVDRTFVGTDEWRRRVGVIAGDPKFTRDAYEVMKHNHWGATGEDLWAWATYAYLRVKIHAPVAGELTLQVDGVHLQVNDPHTTTYNEDYPYSVQEIPYTKHHTFSVEAGDNEVTLDLLFPDEGGPWYYSRVLALHLSGFEVAPGETTSDYTLTDLSLIAKGQAYLKLAFGKQAQRNDYSALVAAVNGAFVTGNWPDQHTKQDEIGPYGGGLRYIYLLTSIAENNPDPIQDSQFSLEAFWGRLNLLEGWTVSYDPAVHNAAMKDSFGRELGPELAQFSLPLVPFVRITPGQAFQPPCAVVCGQVQLVNGFPFTVKVDHPLWGALEAVAEFDGGRAGAGISIGAVREDTEEIVAVGSTDADGYVTVSPVPGNGDVRFFLVEA
jgi:hypothetical protein